MRKLRRLFASPLAIALVALAFRLFGIALGHAYSIVPVTDHYGFADEMGLIARSITLGQGFSSPYRVPTGPTALMPPVYPALLAGVFRVFGINTPSAAIVILGVDSLFSALTCVYLFLIGKRAFTPTTGVLAAWVWVFWPSAALLPVTQVWYDSLSALLLAAAFWLTLRLEGSASATEWAGLGLLWGLAALTNPSLLAPMPFLLGWLCYRQAQRSLRWARLLAAALAVFAVTILPWLIRNHRVFDRPVFIRDGFGLQLYLGNHAGATGARTGDLDPPDNAGEWEQYRRLGEIEYMAVKQQQGVQFILAHPARFAWLCLQRFGQLWIWTGDFRPFGSLLNPTLWEAFYLVLPLLAVAGLIRAFREGSVTAWPFAWVLFAYPLVYIATTMDPRYRHPVEPEMIVLAVYVVLFAIGDPFAARPASRQRQADHFVRPAGATDVCRRNPFFKGRIGGQHIPTQRESLLATRLPRFENGSH